MNLIDSVLTNPLEGFFTGITFLVLVNILVALLASNVERLHDQVIINTVLKRANEIFNVEKSWDFEEKEGHIKYLNAKINNPHIGEIMEIEDTDEKIEKLEDELSKQKDVLSEMNRHLEKNVSVFNLVFYMYLSISV